MAERPKTDPARTRPEEEPGRLSRKAQTVAREAIDRVVRNDWLTGSVLVVVFTALLSVQHCGVALPAYQVGDIAKSDFLAPFDVTVVALDATEARRREEQAKILPVYTFEQMVLERGSELLTQQFEAGRAFQAARDDDAGELGVEERNELRQQLTIPMQDAAFDLLLADDFSDSLEAVLLASYGTVRREKIVDNRLLLLQASTVHIREPGGVEIRFDRLDSILGLEEARGRVSQALRQGLPRLARRETSALTTFLEALVNPNLRYDAVETQRRREEAARAVQPLVTKLRRGSPILRAGERVTEEQLLTLRQLGAEPGQKIDLGSAVGHGILVTLLISFLWRYVHFLPRESRPANLFGMNMVVGLGLILLSWASLWLGEGLAERLARPPFDRVEAYYYAIPVAAGAMLMALLSQPRIAMIFSIFLSVAFGVLADWDLHLGLYALVGSFAGIYGISQYKQRTVVIKAGMIVGAVNGVTILAFIAIDRTARPMGSMVFDIAAGLAGGVLVAIVVSFLLPVLEWMFNVLTDIRLLELSNLNSPLLSKLAVKAPGTYNHSVIVGTLAEAAAQAVGVNALLCRVAAYYHDIGKMSKPEYFIENQMDATGRHKKLSPTMSSLIIASHVKDGVKMAREYNLPQQIIDIIPQHHGTRLITYFFKKAKAREVSEIQEVSESNFRYPGPRPRTKEAAIFMMADSVEAAARTVDDPTPAKFKDLIRQIVNAVILDDQLTETNLTFSDLDRIQDSFLKTLSSIYHHRIEYPGFKFEDRPGRERATLPGIS